jgi:hypothetical protein
LEYSHLHPAALFAIDDEDIHEYDEEREIDVYLTRRRTTISETKYAIETMD